MTEPPVTRDTPSRHGPTRRALIWAATVLVHAAAVPARAGSRASRTKSSQPLAPAILTGRAAEGLPPAVADMRSAILAAVETGDITEVKGAMDLNELPPNVGAAPGADPIEHLRSLSNDGSGKDVLAAIGKLLDGTWAAIPGGRDIENNRIYVWPRFAELAPVGPEDIDGAALVELVGEQAARDMLEKRVYEGWRLSIGADGVWHMLTQVKP